MVLTTIVHLWGASLSILIKSGWNSTIVRLDSPSQLYVCCVACCTECCIPVVGIIGLTPSERSQLADPTPPTPKDPNTYPVMIQVFHNIHCLNNLRQAIWRDDYPFTLERLPDGRVNRTTNRALHLGKSLPIHFFPLLDGGSILANLLDHCIDSLREALMCASDITPISFEVKGEDHHVAPKLSTTHICRDFDALKGWAKTRQIDSWKMETSPAAGGAKDSFRSEDHHHAKY